MRKCFVAWLFMLAAMNCAAQTCDKIPFYPSGHIRNGSLEQSGNLCYAFVQKSPYGGTNLEYVVPGWHFPFPSYTALLFSACRGFRPVYDSSRINIDPNAQFTYYPHVPLPIPDGQNVWGSAGGYIVNFLQRPLIKDSLYKLTFFVGLGIKDTVNKNGRFFYSSTANTRITIWGKADSTSIPVNITQEQASRNFCISDPGYGNWVELGSVEAGDAAGKWSEASIRFTAPANLQVLAIGTSCEYRILSDGTNTATLDRFVFIDKLQLYQSTVPQPTIEIAGGDMCDIPGSTLSLHMKYASAYTGSVAQWYKDGMAIPGQTGAVLILSKSKTTEGSYRYGVVNDSVCAMSNSVMVNWDPPLPPYIGSGPDTTGCTGDTLILRVNAGTRTAYEWNNLSAAPYLPVSLAGTYTVRVSNSCAAATLSKTVSFRDCPPSVWVPSAFSPNNDGLNDAFRATLKGVTTSFSLSVFNRNGQRIFFSRDYTEGWDGTIQRQPQQAGVYAWMVHYTDANNNAKTLRGTVLLLR